MRWFVFFLLVCAGLWYWKNMEEPAPMTAEETFIGEQVKTLRKAEKFEDSYLDMNDEHKKKMEEQLEKDSGGH
jgi:hypothetical protein